MMIERYAKIERKTVFLVIILILSFVISFYNWYDITLGGDTSALRPVINFFKGQGFFPHQKPWSGGNILVVPFFVIMGFNIFAYRLAESFFITLTILLFYLFVKEFYGIKTALLCSLFLAINPFFVLMKFDDVTFYPFFTVSILLFSYKYYKTEKIVYLSLASLIAGYAIYFKLLILYILISIFLSFIFVKFILIKFLKVKLKNIKITKNHIFFAVLFFLIGSSLLIIYNFETNFSTLNDVFSNSVKTQYGYNNFEIIKNLQERLKQFMYISSEKSAWFSIYLGGECEWCYKEGFSFNIFLFLLCIPVILWYGSQKDYFLLGMLLVFLFLSIFVPTVPHPFHLFAIFPIFILLISRFLTLFKFKTKKAVVIIILITIFSFLNVQTTFKAVNTLKNQTWVEDNLPERAMVHYEASLYLKDAPYVVMPASVPVLDDMIPLQQKGHLYSLCNVGFLENEKTLKCPEAARLIDKMLNFSETLYIFPSPLRKNFEDVDNRIFPGICHEKTNPCDIPLKILQEKSSEKNKILVLETRINDSRGYPVYDIYSVRTS